MKRLSVTHVSRNFSSVLDDLERDQEEVVLLRNQRQIARLVPEAPQDALSVFGDLYRTLDDEMADALSAGIASYRKARRGRVSELRDGFRDRTPRVGPQEPAIDRVWTLSEPVPPRNFIGFEA